MNRTKITAHRGYCKTHIENTLPAFEEALRLGCDRIEFDVHYSSDMKLVVHHDYCLTTRSGEQRPILEVPYAEMPSMVPLLEDVLEIMNSHVELEIELKGCSAQFIKAVVAEIDRRNFIHRVEFTSPHAYVLSHVRSVRKDVKLGMFVSPFSEWMPKAVCYRLIAESLSLGQLDVAHCPITILNSGFVEELHLRGNLVHAANCNSQAELEEAFRLGVDQLSTDELELALSLKVG